MSPRSTVVPSITAIRALAWAPRKHELPLYFSNIEMEYHDGRADKSGTWVALKYNLWTVEIAHRPKSLYHWLCRVQYTDHEETLNTVHRYGVSLPIAMAGVLAAARNVPDRLPECMGSFVEAYYIRRGRSNEL